MSEMISCLLFLSVTALHFLPALTTCANNITAVYAFGDGFYDTGNNNHRSTICSANQEPYGSTFPDKFPTGRFSDAEVPADIIAKYLGIKNLLLPYSDSSVEDTELLTGVSFASACSGMDEFTAAETMVLSLTKQFRMFQGAVARMKKAVGKEKTATVVQRALYLISGGTHDFLNNFYVLPFRHPLSLSAYIHLLHANLEIHIKRLHSMGAMKIAVAGMPPIGCLPFDVVTKGGFLSERKCVDLHNKDAEAYNIKLQSRLQALQVSLPGTKIVYVDIYTPILEMVKYPERYGMEVTMQGCCATGSLELGHICGLGKACVAPSKYVFWDAIHPTQAAFRIITEHIEVKSLPSLLF